MNPVVIAKELLKLAKMVLAMPLVYESINKVKFYIYSEKMCNHHTPHVHIIDGGKKRPSV